jgi:hypothetical protein
MAKKRIIECGAVNPDILSDEDVLKMAISDQYFGPKVRDAKTGEYISYLIEEVRYELEFYYTHSKIKS